MIKSPISFYYPLAILVFPFSLLIAEENKELIPKERPLPNAGNLYKYWEKQRNNLVQYDLDPSGQKTLIKITQYDKQIKQFIKKRETVRKTITDTQNKTRQIGFILEEKSLTEDILHLQAFNKGLEIRLAKRQKMADNIAAVLGGQSKKILEAFLPISYFDIQSPQVRADLRRILTDLSTESPASLFKTILREMNTSPLPPVVAGNPKAEKSPKKKPLNLELVHTFLSLGPNALKELGNQFHLIPNSEIQLGMEMLRKLGAKTCTTEVLLAVKNLNCRRNTTSGKTAEELKDTMNFLLRVKDCPSPIIPHLSFFIELGKDSDPAVSVTAIDFLNRNTGQSFGQNIQQWENWRKKLVAQQAKQKKAAKTKN